MLFGEAGNDTYIFRRDSGQDIIIDSDPTAGNTDTIWLGSNLTPNDVSLRRIGNDLVVRINETTDKLTVRDYFRNDSPLNRIEQIQFQDGTTWDVNEIYHRITLPTETDDIIHGSTGNDTLQGYGGDDTLYGHEGNDNLLGGTGVDKLYGDAGDDTLDGGSGDDIIDGGLGNDTYIFGKGSGRDTITDTDTTDGNIDIIKLGTDITPADIKLQRIGEDLKISINGTIDTLTVKNWFLNEDPRYLVENIKFANGTLWDVGTVKQMVIQGTESNNTLIGYSSPDIINGLAGNDQIYGRTDGQMAQGKRRKEKGERQMAKGLLLFTFCPLPFAFNH